MALTPSSAAKLKARALRNARRYAEGVMSSQCRIEHHGPRGAFDGSTGQYAEGDRVVVYAGRCKMRSMGPGIPEGDDAGRPAVVERYELLLPVSAAGSIVQADVVTMLDTGKIYRVDSVDDAVEERKQLHVNVVGHDVWPD